MNVLILGVGNILLSDEGIGVRVVERLMHRFQFPDNVTLHDGGTAGMELLDMMANRDLIILVDAVRTGRAPSDTVVLRGDEVPAFFRTRISPHQVGLSDLLATLKITDEFPKQVVVVGIEPVSLETNVGLSAAVESKMDELEALVLSELSNRGIEPTRLATSIPHTPLSLCGAVAV